MPLRKSISASFDAPAYLSISKHRFSSRSEVVPILKWTRTATSPSNRHFLLPLALSESLHIEFANQKLTLSTRTELLQGVTRNKNASHEWPSPKSPVGHPPDPSRTSLWLCTIFLLSRVHRNWCRLDASPDIVLQLSLKFSQVVFYNHRSNWLFCID